MCVSLVWSGQVCSGFKVGEEALMFPSFFFNCYKAQSSIDLSAHHQENSSSCLFKGNTNARGSLEGKGASVQEASFNLPHISPFWSSLHKSHWHKFTSGTYVSIPAHPNTPPSQHIPSQLHPSTAYHTSIPAASSFSKTWASRKLSSCSNWKELQCDPPQGWDCNWMQSALTLSFFFAHLLKDNISSLSTPWLSPTQAIETQRLMVGQVNFSLQKPAACGEQLKASFAPKAA